MYNFYFGYTQEVTCGGTIAFEILHFTKTNGFDHNTRSQSAQMFTDIGVDENFTITDSQDASVFDDLNRLLDYEVIVFSNTSGDDNPDTLLTSLQKSNLEEYIDQGGAYLGIHAASDTYRTGWSYYNDLVGGIVQTNPNHTPNNYEGTMDVIGSHPSTENLPDPWEKREEYYYWQLNGGRLDTNEISETLRVRSTGSNSYDEARAISWYQEFDSGARSYYTALGHNRRDYTDVDAEFRQLIRDALCWLVEAESTILPIDLLSFNAKEESCDKLVLNWETGESYNFSHIELEGSNDGNSFYFIKRFDELSGSRENERIKYEYPILLSDKDKQYYRLKMIDHDASFSYSEVLTRIKPCIDKETIDLFPNPVSRSQELYLKVPPNESYSLALILDSSGRVIRRITGTTHEDEHVHQISTEDLNPGVYYIHILESARVLKFVVTK